MEQRTPKRTCVDHILRQPPDLRSFAIIDNYSKSFILSNKSEVEPKDTEQSIQSEEQPMPMIVIQPNEDEVGTGAYDANDHNIQLGDELYRELMVETCQEPASFSLTDSVRSLGQYMSSYYY